MYKMFIWLFVIEINHIIVFRLRFLIANFLFISEKFTFYNNVNVTLQWNEYHILSILEKCELINLLNSYECSEYFKIKMKLKN